MSNHRHRKMPTESAARKSLILGTAYLFLLLMPFVASSAGYAEYASDDQPQAASPDLAELNLEDLLNVKVTLASRKSESLNDIAAAAYVITQDEIRRSGMTTIPELLRLVPGMQVGHADASQWAVSSRGFNEVFANKLLVLIDGRSVYNPLFSGVYWDTHDTIIEDIDHIEVIRGPGAALWGANAVNGIVNVVTKSAWDTQGSLAVTNFGGGEETSLSTLRFGGLLTDNARFRVYAKNVQYGTFADGFYGQSDNSRKQNCGGFRADWDTSKGKMTLQGDAYEGEVQGQNIVGSLSPPYSEVLQMATKNSGHNFIFRWASPEASQVSSSVQLYYDRVRDNTPTNFSETTDTWDLDFQREVDAGQRHDLMWGLGYRSVNMDIADMVSMQFNPARRTDNLLSAFVQDGISLNPGKSRLTLGTKIEHNNYTGLEVQPSARLSYSPGERETLWAGVSRAVRTPSPIEDHLWTNLGLSLADDGRPILIKLQGNTDYKSEELLAYELGYRLQPTSRLSFDIASFYNVYSNLRTLEPQGITYSDSPLPHYEAPTIFDNKMSGTSRGLEIVANWCASENWRITATGSCLDLRTTLDPTSHDSVSSCMNRLSPKQQFSLRSYLDISDRLEFDALLFLVGTVKPPQLAIRSPDIPAYSRLDLRLGWKARKDLNVSFGVRNALNDRHMESGSTLGEVPAAVERSIYTSFDWRF